jgi:hypothetical protein
MKSQNILNEMYFIATKHSFTHIVIQTENKINEHNKFETNFKQNVIIQKRLVKEEFILILDFYQMIHF